MSSESTRPCPRCSGKGCADCDWFGTDLYPNLHTVILEPGWLDRAFRAAQETLSYLPPALREQTPARRAMRAKEADRG
jgi:hypothetical protein